MYYKSLQVTERGDAHPQQPFTIIHSRLLEYSERGKHRGGENGEGGACGRILALRKDAEIKLAKVPTTTKLHMLRLEE